MNLTELLLHSSLPVREISESESSQLKQTLLEMYRDISFVCKKEGLTLFLGGGPVLVLYVIKALSHGMTT